MPTNTTEYFRQYYKNNVDKMRAISRKAYWKKQRNPERKEKLKNYRRVYMESYRRKHGIPERIFTGQPIKFNSRAWLKKIGGMHGMICVECGAKEKLTINHKIPVCIGGTDKEENLEIMCFGCNIRTYHKLVKVALKFYFSNR